ncbi:MAG: GGDEF domain-containing protein [Solirubrobacteraceae bacterium]
MESGATRTAGHKARNGALLFGAASLVTALGLLLPHQTEVDEKGLVAVVAGSAALALVLVVAGGRLNDVGYSVVIGFGTVLISLAALSNGERAGGAAGYDELYYLWVVFYAAYYLRRRALVLQVLVIAVSYGVTLALIDPGPVATSRWLTVIGLVTGGAIVVRLLTEHVEQLLAELEEAARTDRLTGLANRRALEADYRREAARAARTGGPIALVLLDLNRFKHINDLYGHAAGDTALVGVAGRMRSILRSTDVAARVGGDEFVLLLPDSDVESATAVAERLAESAAERYAGITPVGFCFGVAACEAGAGTLDDLMRSADQALYTKKRARYGGASSETPLNAPMGRR